MLQQNEEMLSISTSPVEILLLIIFVAHADLFEQSSSPPERNTKLPKRVEAEQSSYYREYPVAFGQKREIVGVGQSDTANNTLCRYCFQGTFVFGQKKTGAAVFGHCPRKIMTFFLKKKAYSYLQIQLSAAKIRHQLFFVIL